MTFWHGNMYGSINQGKLKMGCMYLLLSSKPLYNFDSYSSIHMLASSYHSRLWSDHLEQFGIQCLAQGSFDMWTEGAGIQSMQSLDDVVLPPEPQQAMAKVTTLS